MSRRFDPPPTPPPGGDPSADLWELITRLTEENHRLKTQPTTTTTTTEGKTMQDGFTIEGRGIKEPTLTTEAFGDRVELRIDDSLNPELWVNVSIETAALFDLLGMLIAQRGYNESKRLQMLEALQADMEG